MNGREDVDDLLPDDEVGEGPDANPFPSVPRTCPLCGLEILTLQQVIPILNHVYAGLEPLPMPAGFIHVQCLKEVVQWAQTISGLTIPRPPHKLDIAPSTEPEEAPDGNE